MQQTDLSKYNNSGYNPGGNALKRILWYYVNSLFFISGLIPSSTLKVLLLRLFGATVAGGVVIKPRVNIKYPWNLQIGNNCWIGEGVWIDNTTLIIIGNNVCLSQGAVLQTGSHNYKKTTFDLITGSIIIEDGVWIGCGAIINQGITLGSHTVLTSGSVATKSTEPYNIYQGNPAIKIRARIIQ
ncbi:WcaF family extracellular polysaccharide biosynthesis acetyltransferase [Mucilaginibacter litoreus]|uniref:WcaF family extracellular polysaccharide biosynthesis acetyltransferase n=1 Tax=Mucilaginibacter litoreus TaxID=1048221 RepID=A0ABW3AXB9_9SPHI